MTNIKKIQSFRMHSEHLTNLKRIADEKDCTQISILEDALMRYFNEYENDETSSDSL